MCILVFSVGFSGRCWLGLVFGCRGWRFGFSVRGILLLVRVSTQDFRVEWFEDVKTAKAKDGWLGEGTKIPGAPIYVRNCYKKMRDLLFDKEKLQSIDKQTYIIKGTPGIGKTTMLPYLLSECLQDDSFTDVLFATSEDVFVARKNETGWSTEGFKHGTKLLQNGNGKALGLVDVDPRGEVTKQGQVVMGFNTQQPCKEFGLHRLVVVASAGSDLKELGKNGDGVFPDELFLPVWRSEEARVWLQHRNHRWVETELDEKMAELDGNCGLTVPRLMEAYLSSNENFTKLLRKFIHSTAGQNQAGNEVTHKDAHTMVILRGSGELLDEQEAPDDRNCYAGEPIGWVSSRVETELLRPSGAIASMIKKAPRAAPYIFEAMVLDTALTKAGLTLQTDGEESICLKFSGTCQLYDAKTMKIEDGILYRARGDNYPSIDACGIPETSDILFFIQTTTAREHTRIQRRHLENIRVPPRCSKVVCLYVVPTTPRILRLQNGQEALTGHKGNKPVSETVASAEDVLRLLKDEVKKKFEPGQ